MGHSSQWQSVDMVSQRPWVQFPAALPFFEGLSHLKGLWTLMARLGLQLVLGPDYGVLAIKFPAVISFMIHLVIISLRFDPYKQSSNVAVVL